MTSDHSAAVRRELTLLCVAQALLNLVYSFTTQHFREQHGPSDEVGPVNALLFISSVWAS